MKVSGDMELYDSLIEQGLTLDEISTRIDYITLSEIFILRKLPLSFVDENNDKNWSFNILSHHPALTVDFVDKYRQKEWCYFTLFDRRLYKKGKKLYIYTKHGTYTIIVPSYFELYSIRRHPTLGKNFLKHGKLKYFNYENSNEEEEYSYDMKIWNLKNPHLFIRYIND